MTKNKKTRLLSLIAGAVFVAGSSVSAFAATTLKLSHNADRNHPVHKSMEFMAKRAKELSGGDLKIRIYPNAQLGTQRESLELIQNGALDMAKSNTSELEAFAKEYGAFNLPYLFRDREHYYSAMQGEAGQEILQSSRKNGFIGLTYYDAGARSFYAHKPINTPADLAGLNVRVQPSPSALAMVRSLGANPTPLSYGELYTALQQGVVDAAENNIMALTINRHGEVTKFYSLDEHTMVPDVLVISAKTWDGLSEENRKALKQAASDSMLDMKTRWAETEQKEQAKAEKMGVKFIYPKKDPFVEAVKPMYDKVSSEDPELYELVMKLRNS